MRISKDKFPILEWLQKSSQELLSTDTVGVWTDDIDNIKIWINQILSIKTDWDGMKFRVGSNVDYVSDSFSQNAFQSKDMLKKIDFESFAKEHRPCGVLLLSGATQYYYDYTDYDRRVVYKFRENALEFLFRVNGDKASFFIEDVDIRLYKGVKQSDITALYGNKRGCEIYARIKEYEGGINKLETKVQNSREEKDKFNQFHIINIVHYLESILLFKHYAKVETIYVKPKEKVKDPITKERHLNETDVPINILDCTWFNNIIRNEPFGVRGHFRLQPKKNDEGEWIKEMIYIKPFIKTGYNIKARKTNK